MNVLVIVVAMVLASASVVGARQPASANGVQQPATATQPAPAETPAVSLPELQRMFDAYALVQAQDQLKIGDDQFSRFLPRFKALQDVRRRALQERTRLILELRRLLMETSSDENQLRDRLKALEDIDARAQAEVRKAYDAIDQVLDVQQQAKFRIFEEQMERRKLELVTRARQANRPKIR